MIISELIEVLKNIKQEYGDITVKIPDLDEDFQVFNIDTLFCDIKYLLVPEGKNYLRMY